LAEYGVSEGLREHIRAKLGELNQTIRNDNNLGPGFCIGHSYFCPRPDEDLAYDAEWFERVVEYDIEPLLREYWFDKPEKVDREVKNLREGLDALE
jgi:5-methylcytosine-specific restriction protein B